MELFSLRRELPCCRAALSVFERAENALPLMQRGPRLTVGLVSSAGVSLPSVCGHPWVRDELPEPGERQALAEQPEPDEMEEPVGTPVRVAKAARDARRARVVRGWAEFHHRALNCFDLPKAAIGARVVNGRAESSHRALNWSDQTKAARGASLELAASPAAGGWA